MLAFAGAFCWAAGRRGFFALDQSIPFDAGWRVLTGQVPFQDFVLPVGPVLPWVMALGLRVFGVDFAGYLATACTLNVLAAAGVMLVTARLFPGRWSLWAVAGGLTAVWFQGPAGTPWFQPLALLVALPGLGLWAASVPSAQSAGLRAATGAAAGAAFALTFLTKQNALLAVAPAACLLLALEARTDGWRAAGRRAAWLAAGGLAAGALVIGWLALLPAAPDQPTPLRAFVLHALEIPAGLAPARVVGRPWDLARIPWIGAGPPAPRAALLGLGLISLARLLVHLVPPAVHGPESAGSRRRRTRVATAAALAAGLYWGSNLLALTLRNQTELAYGLTGLVVALGLGVAGEALRELGGRWRVVPGRFVRRTLAALAVAAVAWRGTEVALARSVHEGVAGAASYEAVRTPSLRPLRWAVPTVLRDVTVERTTLERLVRRLEDHPGGLFVFPDWTILYGLLGRPSPQPLLWFHPGLTYPRDAGPERRSLDRRLVEALEARRVQTFVLERTSWLGTKARLADFPRLRRYLERCFRLEQAVGPFEIRSRREACRAEQRSGTYSTISRSSTSKVSGPAGLPVSPA